MNEWKYKNCVGKKKYRRNLLKCINYILLEKEKENLILFCQLSHSLLFSVACSLIQSPLVLSHGDGESPPLKDPCPPTTDGEPSARLHPLATAHTCIFEPSPSDGQETYGDYSVLYGSFPQPWVTSPLLRIILATAHLRKGRYTLLQQIFNDV